MDEIWVKNESGRAYIQTMPEFSIIYAKRPTVQYIYFWESSTYNTIKYHMQS